MLIDLVIYIFGFTFIFLGGGVAIWSFIDTHRIRSGREFSKDRDSRLDNARKRYKDKTRK
ncbi:hypothetical protein Q4Q49_12980 [Shewanella sp. SP1S1-7]|uniref:hypothetical protein n=1 Tax=Shewanella sp. SP1S1-7 TaxID=3063536 RepID=UPI00288EA555|nr:hypothetical protein [Shewanella sp. SP1S1-7]MDT3336217.1 hypothetical protein [Shewanella sp. SP1S1-7]